MRDSLFGQLVVIIIVLVHQHNEKRIVTSVVHNLI